MKNLKKSFLLTIVFLIIMCKPGVASTFATPNVELEGNAKGIVFISGDEPFLWSDNVLPGDKLERNIVLRNNYDSPYKIFMKASRVTKKEKYDLLEKMDLRVTYDGINIYTGPVSGENGLEENIFLGTINPGESKTLNAVASFPGKTMGNEYKNKKGQVDWIFTAVRLDGGRSRNKPNELDNNSTAEYSKDNDYANRYETQKVSNNSIEVAKTSSSKASNNNEEKHSIPYTGDRGYINYFIIIVICLGALLIINSNFKKDAKFINKKRNEHEDNKKNI